MEGYMELPESSDDAPLTDFKRNNRWITENYPELAKIYCDQWVAVLNCAVLDQDADVRKLVERLKASHPQVYENIAVEHIVSQEPEPQESGLFH